MLPFPSHSARSNRSDKLPICQAASSNPTNRFQESSAVIILPIIEPKHFFIKITEQMKRFDADVCSLKAAFQQAPKILQSVRVDVPLDVAFRVVNRLVDVISIKSLIRHQF